MSADVLSQRVTEEIGRLKDENERLQAENETLRAQMDHLAAASSIFSDQCQCENPLVKCDHLGCRCQICGKLG